MYILGISEALFDFQLLVQIKACFERKQYSVAIVTDMEMEEEKEDIYSVYDYFSPELSSENLIKANHYIKEIELNKDVYKRQIWRGRVWIFSHRRSGPDTGDIG